MKKNGKRVSAVEKTVGIVVHVLLACFFLFCLTGLFLSVMAKQTSDGAIKLFGYEMRLVVSNSMEKSETTDVREYAIQDIPIHSLIFIETVPEGKEKAWYDALKIGDVLTFRYVYTKQETITHRIVEIKENEQGGYTIVLEGDNKNATTGALQQVIDTSQTNSLNYVIGKVTGKSIVLGYLVTFLQSTWGIIFIVIVPCLIIIFIEISRIIRVIREKDGQEATATEK